MATIGTILILVLIFYALGRKYPPARRGMGPGPAGHGGVVRASQVERENPGLVGEDIRQMFRAQNELRRARGAPELTEADLRSAVAEDEQNRSRGRGPFGADL